MQLGINNQILILGSQKEKTSLRKAARGLKMGDKPGHRPTNTGDDSRLPTPESDCCPAFTKFVNDVGDFYVKTADWPKMSAEKLSDKAKNKVFATIEKYLSETFANILRRELRIPKM